MADNSITRKFGLYLMHAPGIVLRHKDEGITIGPDGVSYQRGGTPIKKALADMTTVTLNSASVPRMGTSYICRIDFNDGTHISATTMNTWGNADPRRKPVFRDFVTTLHRLLVESGAAKSIAFNTGYGATRSSLLLTSLGVAAGLLIVVPLGIFAATREASTFLLCLAGAALILPSLRMALRNKPGIYRPESPPDLTQ